MYTAVLRTHSTYIRIHIIKYNVILVVDIFYSTRIFNFYRTKTGENNETEL